jgi:hypothetical protein
MRSFSWLVVAFSMCQPPPPLIQSATVEQQVQSVVSGLDPRRGRAVLAGDWDHHSGLVLRVPEGWEAWEGLPGDIRLLQLRHLESAVEVSLYRIINLAPEEPPVRRGNCEWIFQDAGRHSLVPAFRPAKTSTCIGLDVDPMVVQVWVGSKLDADFAIEVVYPQGRVVAGSQWAEPILKSLRWR